MILKKRKIQFIFTLAILWSFLFGSAAQRAQDLMPAEDLSLGASIFVFRKSRTNPQSKSTSRRYFLRNSPSRAAANPRRRFEKTVAANYKRRPAKNRSTAVTAKSRAQSRKAAAVAAAERRNKLSETLTAQADAQLETGETDKAIENYKSALKNNAQNQSAKSGLSEAYIVKGDETMAASGGEAAKNFYQEAIALDAANYAAHAKLAAWFEEMKSPDDALAEYQKALKINPSAKELFVPIANLYYQKDDYAAAETYLKRAEASVSETADAVFLRALLHYRRSENEQALAAFKKLLVYDPDFIEAYLYQAEIYERLNRNQEAIFTYRRTVEKDPKSIEAWFDLGAASYNQGDYQTAEKAYKRVIELDANHADAHANLASVYRQMNRFAEANAEYKLAAVRITDDPDLFSEWGFCLGKTEEWDKAVARLQKAKDLSPDTVDYTNLGWGYYNAAQKDIKADNDAAAQAKFTQGKEALQIAVALNPNFDAAQLNLGVTYTGLGEYQNAVEALNKANSLRKDWVIGINELGVAYRKLNNLSEAINQFQRVVNLDDKFALGYFNLGEAQSKLGRKNEAKKTLARLKQLNPNLASRLDAAIEGRILDETKQQIKKRIPIPKLPF